MNKHEPVYIGDVLKRHRMAKQLSQEELAYRSSLDRKSVSELERNNQEPRMSTVLALASALEVDAIDFIKDIIDSTIK